MQKIKWLFIPVAALIVLGCDAQFDQLKPSYEMHNIDGQLYRLNIKTGEVAYITQEGLRTLSEETHQLKIGRYYRKEGAAGEYEEDAIKKGKRPFLKYLGNGKFQDSMFAVLHVDKSDSK